MKVLYEKKRNSGPSKASIQKQLDSANQENAKLKADLDSALSQGTTDINTNSNLVINAKQIPGWESIDPGQYRVKYANGAVGKVIPTLGDVNWGSVKESDSDFSGYTTASITGQGAKQIYDILNSEAESNKIHKNVQYEKPTETAYFYQIPGVDDAQLFSFETKDNNGEVSDIEVKLVVRPIELQKEITILI